MAALERRRLGASLQFTKSMTYKTAWYVTHRVREAMREAKDIQLGDPETTVEIDETYIGGSLRRVFASSVVS